MEGIDTVAQLMAMAAITAPKTRGENFVQVKLLQGQEVQQLGQTMLAYGQSTHKGNFDRDFVMGIPLSVSGKSIYFDRR